MYPRIVRIGSTALFRLDNEKAAHEDTRDWSEKTNRHKDEEIDELRKNVAGLILSAKSASR